MIPYGSHVLTPNGEGVIVGSDAAHGFTVRFYTSTGRHHDRRFQPGEVTRKPETPRESVEDFMARKARPNYKPLPLPRSPGWPLR